MLQMDYLRQMQHRFAGELSLQQALRDLTNVMPGRLHLNVGTLDTLGYILCIIGFGQALSLSVPCPRPQRAPRR
jgi:hypothetical protein